MEIGQRLRGQINNINEKGIYVSFPDGSFGHMPYSLRRNTSPINRWDYIEVVVFKVYDNQGIQLCDADYWEALYRTRDFADQAEPGNVYEAIVKEVNSNYIVASLNNVIDGYISRDDISWNRIESIEDIVYVGEPVHIVYVGNKNDRLQFGLRYLDEKPYKDEMYDLNLSQLLEYAGHHGSTFIGKARKYPTFWRLENICSANPGEEGKLLTDPDYGHNLMAVATISTKLEEGKYYRFSVKLVEKEKRLERNQLFQFQAYDFHENQDPYSYDTLQIFKKNTSPRTNVTAAHLLEEVGQNMYSAKDRMFFELIQNADDASSKKGVTVKVETQGDYLTLSHNGFSFDRDDFEAITSAANGTKKANENKTGYKGIGFKSVFTDSEQVYRKTGGYQFKFEKTQPQFQNFEAFYFFVNELASEEAKINFCTRFATEKRNFKGVKDIPWQMEPIWVRSFPDEIAAIKKNANVCIALKLGADKIEAAKGYRDTIDSIMSNPRFMLFLRNTKRIDFNKRSVSKEIKDGVVTIKNSFNECRSEVFVRKDYSVPVNDQVFQELGIDIRRRIIEKDGDRISDATFINGRGQEYDNIPKKIAIVDSTEISFAVPFDTVKKHVKPDTKCSQVSMFAYLPTLVKDFKYPFFINANFVLDSSRERIKGDNPWNHYLMAKIAEAMVSWVAELGAAGDTEALNLLSTDYLDESSGDTELLARFFNCTYKSALEKIRFIPAMDKTMSSQDEIIIDKTGLAEIVGDACFCSIIGTQKKLPSSAIQSKILQKKIFSKVESIDADAIADIIVNNAELGTWLTNATEEDRKRFFDWLDKNQDKYPGLAQSLPIFSCGDRVLSASEIEEDEMLVITTARVAPIKDILNKIGFTCSNEQLENSPLSSIITTRTDKELYDVISQKVSTELITTSEKLTLLSGLEHFNEIGMASIKGLSMFRNINGMYTPLNSMVSYRDDAPEWINPYMICRDDYIPELDRFLVDNAHEFSDIIWKNIADVDASVDELYAVYEWTDASYTKSLIDSYAANGDVTSVLSIVEVSDKLTKQHYLSKVQLNLSSETHYDKDSIVCRILHLAKDVLDKPADFASKIFLDGSCIKNISVKDTISISFMNGNTSKTAVLPLSRILPDTDLGAGSISNLKSLFDSPSDIDSFIVATARSSRDVYAELNSLLNIPDRNFSKWPSQRGNAIQYIYSVFYRRTVMNWFGSFVPTIDLSCETSSFVHELMDFLFDNNVRISDSSITCGMSGCVSKKYFRSDYASGEESILPAIEDWADDEKKAQYLIDNGVRKKDDIALLLRKALIDDEPFDELDNIADSDTISALKYLVLNNQNIFPIQDGNRKDLICSIIKRPKFPVSRMIDIVKLSNDSRELDSQEYISWIDGHYPQIFIYDDRMPIQLIFKVGETNHTILSISEGDYYTTADKNVLYINGQIKLDDILFTVAKEGKTAFDLDDYKMICLDGRTLLSTSEIEGMNSELQSLRNEIDKKDELIKGYERRLGIWQEGDQAMAGVPTPNIRNGVQDPLSESEQIDAQLEAQQFLLKAEPSWEFPEGYGTTDDDENPCCFSTIEVNTPDGPLAIVLKSHKRESEPLKVNPQEWEYITKKEALLLIYTGDDIKRLRVNDLIKDQSNITLTFSTTNLEIEERIDAFATSLRYFNNLHFDFESFNLSKKAESIRNITRLNAGSQSSNYGEEAL
ncbi:MAG: S1 RNA-binding domain-containing protein [Bacteroidales bacterium]|nr:S1 RNA-binding domain-containing protein [Bacteroidales bacterium]